MGGQRGESIGCRGKDGAEGADGGEGQDTAGEDGGFVDGGEAGGGEGGGWWVGEDVLGGWGEEFLGGGGGGREGEEEEREEGGEMHDAEGGKRIRFGGCLQRMRWCDEKTSRAAGELWWLSTSGRS